MGTITVTYTREQTHIRAHTKVNGIEIWKTNEGMKWSEGY